MTKFIEAAATVMGIVMSVGYYAQSWKIFRSKSASDVSLLSYIIFSIGTTIWMVYGLQKHDTQIFWGFVFGVIGSWLTLFLTLMYKNNKPHAQ